jgi:pimeloyl-ACP methyl ester carboxylesterase
VPSTINFHREGAGAPLVLIHGIGSRWQMWLPVLGRLAAQRDVIAIDLPGFGFSPRPGSGTPAGPQTLTSLVGELLRDLGLERPHVAGNSLGGWIALELANRGLVRSATALSPAGFYTMLEARFMAASLRLARAGCRLARPDAAKLLHHPLLRRLLFFQLAAHPERIEPFDAAEHVRGVADAEWFDETLQAITEERFFPADSIGVPVTVAWGQHDHLLLPWQAERAAKLLPQARHVTLHGCGHVPTADDPEQVAAVLLEGSSPHDRPFPELTGV